ncbi:MAG TPA: RhoGEF domain-containing protein, partial [archaeon]|nr:RhoGEF domain-containing protein [archaeon]
MHISVGFERADGLDHIERVLVHRRALGKKYQTLSAFLPSFVKILPEDQRLLLTAVGELVFTEVQYVYHLELIIRLYLEPLLCRCLMTRADLWLLFSNVHLILEAHEALLADELSAWKKVVRTQDINVDFGEILLAHVSIFQLYAAYCSNQSAARQFVGSKVDSRPAVKAYVTGVEQRTDLKRETLRGFLIVPVQRLCKYPLLVREVMRRTDPASPSYPKLSKLLEVVTEQSNHVNERAIQVERFQEMIELSRRFVNATEFGLVSRNRYFGASYQVTHLSTGRSFLMNVMSDCILLSVRNPDAAEGSTVAAHRIVRL